MKITKSRLHRIARAWRKKWPDEKGGYVIIHNLHAVGWTIDLSAPHKWVPGCLAVPDYLNAPIYQATGGGECFGAKRWSRCTESTGIQKRRL